jgi:hypothetical protein
MKVTKNGPSFSLNDLHGLTYTCFSCSEVFCSQKRFSVSIVRFLACFLPGGQDYGDVAAVDAAATFKNPAVGEMPIPPRLQNTYIGRRPLYSVLS